MVVRGENNKKNGRAGRMVDGIPVVFLARVARTGSLWRARAKTCADVRICVFDEDRYSTGDGELPVTFNGGKTRAASCGTSGQTRILAGTAVTSRTRRWNWRRAGRGCC